MRETKLLQRFGKRVQNLRKEKGLSQEAMAESIGKTVNTVSNIERGVYPTSLDTVALIADTLSVPAAELFDRSEIDEVRQDKRRELSKLIDLLKDHDVASIKCARIILESSLELGRSVRAKRRTK